jgi:uncharacterized membrane protein YdfJ with MMPL/SSD domain
VPTTQIGLGVNVWVSVFIWETPLGIQLHWLTLPIAFIVLVAVGCDYNLLPLSRYKQEIGARAPTRAVRTCHRPASPPPSNGA